MARHSAVRWLLRSRRLEAGDAFRGFGHGPVLNCVSRRVCPEKQTADWRPTPRESWVPQGRPRQHSAGA